MVSIYISLRAYYFCKISYESRQYRPDIQVVRSVVGRRNQSAAARNRRERR